MGPTALASKAFAAMKADSGGGESAPSKPDDTDPKIAAAKKFAAAIGVDSSKAAAIADAFATMMEECGPMGGGGEMGEYGEES